MIRFGQVVDEDFLNPELIEESNRSWDLLKPQRNQAMDLNNCQGGYGSISVDLISAIRTAFYGSKRSVVVRFFGGLGISEKDLENALQQPELDEDFFVDAWKKKIHILN